MSRLQHSVAVLYDVFRPYRLGESMIGCPCCVSEDAKAALHRVPLAELSWDDLTTYCAKAMTTFGTVDDFKHFVPRILELSATQPTDAPFHLYMILGKLAYGGWADWPQRERAAISEYAAAFREALQAPPDGGDWDEWTRQDISEGLAAIEVGAD